jgi:hypothetical protein
MMYSHRGVSPSSRFCGQSGPRFPIPGQIGNSGDFPIPDSRPNRESGDFPIPDSRQKIGNRGNGNWGFPGLGGLAPGPLKTNTFAPAIQGFGGEGIQDLHNFALFRRIFSCAKGTNNDQIEDERARRGGRADETGGLVGGRGGVRTGKAQPPQGRGLSGEGGQRPALLLQENRWQS